MLILCFRVSVKESTSTTLRISIQPRWEQQIRFNFSGFCLARLCDSLCIKKIFPEICISCSHNSMAPSTATGKLTRCGRGPGNCLRASSSFGNTHLQYCEFCHCFLIHMWWRSVFCIFRFEMPYNIWCDGCKNHIGMGMTLKLCITLYYSYFLQIIVYKLYIVYKLDSWTLHFPKCAYTTVLGTVMN